MTTEERGSILLDQAEKLLTERALAEAVAAFDAAEGDGADPDRCAGGRWMAYMYAGDFQRAWEQSDAIRARGTADPNRFWNGECIHGKHVMVRCLHGLGDAVQMLRFMPLLQQRCAGITLQVPPRLLPLAPWFLGVSEAITWGDGAPGCEPAWDVQVEVMELPYLLRVSSSELTVCGDYLQLPDEVSDVYRPAMARSARPKVGLVWSASEWDRTRCLPMSCLDQITSISGIEFWNLQGEPAYSCARQHPALANVHDAADFGEGLQPLAACIDQLDLLLSVDTLAAHLSGAMGSPAWVLLQHQADWRWMHARDDSPWYPALKLWRQPRQDDWAALTGTVCEALLQWRENFRGN